MRFGPNTRCRTRLAALFILTLLTIAYALPAQARQVNRPTDAKGWSTLIHNRYKSIMSMSAQFEQTITHKESGIEEQRQGDLYFKKPFLVRWLSKPPHSELIVVGNEFLWQYFPDEELALKFKASDIDDQSEFLSVLTGRAPLVDRFKIVPQEEVEGVFSLKLVPFSPTMNLVEATIWVDMESGIILRLLYADFYGNLNDISFTNQTLNQGISDDMFSVKLPQNTLVEDHSK